MKKLLLLVAAFAFCMTAAAQTFATADANKTIVEYVSVIGHAEREVAPDEIYISFTIDETSGRNKISVEQQEAAMIDAFVKLGVDVDKDLQVASMVSDLQEYFFKKDKIQTTKKYNLLLHDAETVSSVFAALAELNISDVRITRLSRSDAEAIRSELRVEAVKKAQTTAKELAEAVGQSIGKAITIEDNQRYYANNDYETDMVVAYGISAKSTSSARKQPALQFKNIKFESNITASFALNRFK